MTETTNAAQLTPTYEYTNGGLITTVIRPGGATEITTRYLDGRTKSVTGTGVIARYYEYGINPDGTQWTKVLTGSETSPRWEKSTSNLLGQQIRTERPGFSGTEMTENFYNELGQLIKTSTTGLTDTLYEYDEAGEMFRQGMDLNGNGVLDLASEDRISETMTQYKQIGDDWWQESSQIIYDRVNDDTPKTVNTQRSRISGLGSDGLISENVAIDMFGKISTSKSFIDREQKLERRITDVPDSTIDGLAISVNGLLQSTRNTTNITTEFRYDVLGRQTKRIDQRTGPSLTHYNDKGQVDYVIAPSGERTDFTYDATTGQKIAETNALGKTTRFAYNVMGQLTHAWGDVPYPVRYEYNTYGQMTAMFTYRGGTGWDSQEWPEATAGTADSTHWIFQEATGLLLTKEDAEGKQLTYTYTTGGKLETRTWARLDSGNPLTTTYSYHPQTGELESIDYSDTTPDISFTYDRLGQPDTITDAVGTRTFTYNDYNQLETETITGLYNETITRTYEQTGVPGRSSGFTFGADYQINYGYDSTGRFNTVSWNVNGSSNSATYTYHSKADLITQMTVTGAVADYTATYTYHPKRNLKQRVENRYGTTLISSYYSTVDELGRRNATITSGSAFTTNPTAFNLYDYNDRSELIESSRYQGTDITDLTAPITDEYRQYIFDNIGNREEATEAAETGTYTTNSLNQYTDLIKGPQTETFTHDDDGNLISRTADGKTIQYTFNGENRLIAIEPQTPQSGDIRVTMRYDYMGRRVEKKAYSYNGSDWTEDYTKHFLYDGWNLVKETTTENSTTTAKYYTWGLDLSQSLQGAGGIGGLIATVSDSDTNYHCYDLNGNKTQLLSEADGTITAHIEYDPFGNDINSYGLLSENDPFRFSTKYHDSEYNLYYYGYRYYVPELGRWLTRDPIGERGGLNLFGFTLNSPLNLYDYLGKYFGIDDAIFTIGGGIAGTAGLLIIDVFTGTMSDWEDYVAAFVGGAVAGEMLLYTGPVAAGLAGGAAGNLTSQAIKYFTQDKKCDPIEFGVMTLVGGMAGFIPGGKFASVTTGRNSFNAIYKQIVTKATAKQINNVTGKTAVKMLIGRGADTALLEGALFCSFAGHCNNPTDGVQTNQETGSGSVFIRNYTMYTLNQIWDSKGRLIYEEEIYYSIVLPGLFDEPKLNEVYLERKATYKYYD